MIAILLYVIIISFAVGALAIVFISKKEAGTSAERWIKYCTYLFIVVFIVTAIAFEEFNVLGFVILLTGLYELIRIWIISAEKRTTFFTISVIIYLVISYSFVKFSSIKNYNEQLYVYTLVFTFDGFSQITGQIIGRRKPFSRVSPNKTLEGALGGLFTTLIVSVFIGKFLKLSIAQTLLISSSIALISFLGDLLASYYKRHYHVKDYSNLIPGHGGVLDRFDSFIAAGAFYYFIVY